MTFSVINIFYLLTHHHQFIKDVCNPFFRFWSSFVLQKKLFFKDVERKMLIDKKSQWIKFEQTKIKYCIQQMLKIINICIFIGFTGYRFRKEASPCHIIDMFAKKIIMNSQLLINRIHFLYPFHRTQFFWLLNSFLRIFYLIRFCGKHLLDNWIFYWSHFSGHFIGFIFFGFVLV